MIEVAGGILLSLLALGVLMALVKASADRAEMRRIRYQNEQERAWRSLQEANKPSQEEPGATGLQGLGKYLDERQTDEQAEKRSEEDRLARLRGLWMDVSATVEQAVELVNSQLASHKMHVTLSPPDFFGRDRNAFGVLCTLHIDGQSSFGLPYEGEQCLALTDENGGRLYAGGMHIWSDPAPFQLNEVSVDKLADAIADTVKSIVEG